jgi:hypothetical protein
MTKKSVTLAEHLAKARAVQKANDAKLTAEQREARRANMRAAHRRAFELYRQEQERLKTAS